MDEKKIALASRLMRARGTAIAEVCEAFEVSRSTLYRYLEPDGKRRNGAPKGNSQ